MAAKKEKAKSGAKVGKKNLVYVARNDGVFARAKPARKKATRRKGAASVLVRTG